MIQRCIRTCDLCRRLVEEGRFIQRQAEPDGTDLLMILLENQGEELELFESADGTVALDTCFDCATRIAYDRGQYLN